MGFLSILIAIISKRKGYWRNCLIVAIISGLLVFGVDLWGSTQLSGFKWSMLDWFTLAEPAAIDFFTGFIQVVIAWAVIWLGKRIFVWRKEKTAN
jgi:hypothetical protein